LLLEPAGNFCFKLFNALHHCTLQATKLAAVGAARLPATLVFADCWRALEFTQSVRESATRMIIIITAVCIVILFFNFFICLSTFFVAV